MVKVIGWISLRKIFHLDRKAIPIKNTRLDTISFWYLCSMDYKYDKKIDDLPSESASDQPSCGGDEDSCIEENGGMKEAKIIAIRLYGR